MNRGGQNSRRLKKKMTIVHPAEADARRHAWLTSPTFHSGLSFPTCPLGASLLKLPVRYYISACKNVPDLMIIC